MPLTTSTRLFMKTCTGFIFKSLSSLSLSFFFLNDNKFSFSYCYIVITVFVIINILVIMTKFSLLFNFCFIIFSLSFWWEIISCNSLYFNGRVTTMTVGFDGVCCLHSSNLGFEQIWLGAIKSAFVLLDIPHFFVCVWEKRVLAFPEKNVSIKSLFVCVFILKEEGRVS